MEIIPLGTNGFFSSYGRETACYVIPLGKTLVILDAGSGLFRFVQTKIAAVLDSCTEIHLYLSHFHLDHTMGLYAVAKLFKNKPVTIFSQKDSVQTVSDFIRTRDLPEAFHKAYAEINWQYIEKGIIEQKEYTVNVICQKHRQTTSLGYRLSFADSKSVAYITDAVPDNDSIKFAHGATILLHEHNTTGDNLPRMVTEQIEDGHSTTIGAALIAKEEEVKKLYLIHHNPFDTDKILISKLHAAKTVFPESFLAQDLKKILF